jgi:hypothetical protein
VDLEDFQTAALVGDADLDLPVEASGTPQRRVDRVDAVGGADDHDVAAPLQAVHQRQELRDDALLPFPGHLGAPRRDPVQLVDEDDGRGVLLRLLEHRPQALL